MKFFFLAKKAPSKIADRVALLENLFQGRPPAPFSNNPGPLSTNKKPEKIVDSINLEHITFDRAILPQKKNKKSKTIAFVKRMSKEW